MKNTTSLLKFKNKKILKEKRKTANPYIPHSFCSKLTSGCGFMWGVVAMVVAWQLHCDNMTHGEDMTPGSCLA